MATTSSIEASATGTWIRLIDGKIDAPLLLMRGAHRRDLRRHIALDDAVGMGDPAIGAFAGRDIEQLLRRGDERGLGLPERIFGQRAQRR